MQITIDASEVHQAAERLGVAAGEFRREFGRTIGEIGSLCAVEVRKVTPVRSGALRDSIASRMTGELQAEVEAKAMTDSRWPPVRYLAPLVEYPTRAHVISPRRKGGVLFWVDGQGRHFAAYVHHPGTRGAKMFQKGLEATVRLLPAMLDKLTQRFTSRAVGG